MKTCWFFGDSFTRGDNCHTGEPYYNLTYKNGCKRWTEIVSNHLGCKENNHGYGGNSNTHILYQLITESKNIKSGDYVFVGDTRPVRVISFTDDGHVRNIINDSSLKYKKGKGDAKLNYIEEEIFPHEEKYSKYYEEQFIEVLNLIKLKNVSTFFWKHTDYWIPLSRIHTITKDTNGKIKDNHYSWEGHRRKASIIINKLENPNNLL